jgi:hypothetical protein
VVVCTTISLSNCITNRQLPVRVGAEFRLLNPVAAPDSVPSRARSASPWHARLEGQGRRGNSPSTACEGDGAGSQIETSGDQEYVSRSDVEF